MKRLVKNSFSLFLWLLRRVSLFRSPSVRVILGHDTPSESYAWWERLILELRRDFDFITPEEFTDYIEGNLKLKRNAILLTLDDGFHSNYDFCKNVLCRNNISALCFIIDDFIGLNESLSVEFIRKNIYPIATSIPAHWKPMNSRELNELLNLNHEFGYHTKSHMSMKHSTDYEFESNYLEKPKSPILKKNGMKFLAFHLVICAMFQWIEFKFWQNATIIYSRAFAVGLNLQVQ